ncbi:glycine betaine ABC transporter substrate-binding protein [Streptacidiphilus sp. N1-3]|uniref:Glycine betaine ABC transporter substrate-binding protein n=1 Tax=Streptacidiphilus alkalitolerans TaxID=3342712 RepID=A0ABV6WSU0_9ACTN
MTRRSAVTRRLLPLGALLLLAASLAGCGLHSGTVIPSDLGPGTLGKGLPLKGVTLTIASKNFTENVILAEMMGLVWTAAGATVVDRTNISGSIGARQAIVSGTADGMYEYTGTAWITYLGNTKPIADPQRQWQAVHDADLKNGLTWLPQSRLNDTYALGGNAANVAKYHLKTLSDVAALSKSNPSAVTLCVDNEFGVRDDGLTGMEKAYGMSIPKSNIRTMDAGIVYTTLSAGKSCLLGDVYSTDGRIPALKLQVLDDDKHFFPNYDAAPELYSKAVREHPAITGLLDPVSAKLDNTVAQQLNSKVDVDGQDPRAVARQWLIDKGFVVPKK